MPYNNNNTNTQSKQKTQRLLATRYLVTPLTVNLPASIKLDKQKSFLYK